MTSACKCGRPVGWTLDDDGEELCDGCVDAELLAETRRADGDESDDEERAERAVAWAFGPGGDW